MQPYGDFPLYVHINEPEKGFLSWRNQPFLYLVFFTAVIGKTDISIKAFDDSGIDHIDLYIDGEHQITITNPPYTWTWDKFSFFRHKIKAVAYDNSGDENSDELVVWKFF